MGFFWFGLFFPLKICTSQMMGIGLCSPQLAAPSGWQLTGLVLLWLQSPVCSYHSVKSTRGVLSWWKRELWVPKGGGQCQQHGGTACHCAQGQAGGSFPIPTPLSHCAAVVSCTLSSGRTQPRAGMKDATASLGMDGQFIAFLCV